MNTNDSKYENWSLEIASSNRVLLINPGQVWASIYCNTLKKTILRLICTERDKFQLRFKSLQTVVLRIR